ncbi:sugar porter family MFS transporter [Vibrio nitrifigilis]|uniref:Sugar porter family MFS transporter n=1 Tax=Vibrio nitrifigilis TaxID=2789781 RepID=A0ABS0GD85_9VIBR|nr:sugar porter family MFS transporter [Vibrio nitrifigilis]MBF9000364.1 sugar porter family MFS transporter [Vibrio nitrifigilis]
MCCHAQPLIQNIIDSATFPPSRRYLLQNSRKKQESVMSVMKSYNFKYIIMICGVAALGGLLFGYDTAVISGAINPIKHYFDLSSVGVGWAVSNVAIGCIIGAFVSGALAARVGRKKALVIAALLFTISALGASLVDSFTWFIIYRMIGGLAVGLASAISPMYMSEVSPRQIRGRALSMQNFAIVGGQVVIFIVNFMIAKGASQAWLTDMGWRVMIGSEVIPCVAFCIFVLFIPESPRWLVMVNRSKEARKILKKIGGKEYADNMLQAIEESLQEDSKSKNSQPSARDLIKQSRFWLFAFLGCTVAVIQQSSGVNVMMYFAPVVLEKVTGNTETAMFMTIWIGVFQLIGTVIGSMLMDKLGRLPLLKVGSIGAVVGLTVTAFFMYHSAGLTGDAAIQSGYFTLFGMLIFMLFFSFSWGLGAWIVISEIFPNRMRSAGMSLAITAMWVSNFVIGLVFPVLNENPWLNEHFHGAAPMGMFAVIMVLATWFIYRFLPETKGVQLEKMEDHVMKHLNRDKKSRLSASNTPRWQNNRLRTGE